MTTARSTQPQALELEVLFATVVVVVELDVVVVGRALVVVVAGSVVVVVGAVVGGTVVVGASVVVVTGAVVVVSWAPAGPERTPSRSGVAEIATNNATEERRTVECMEAAYGHRLPRSGDLCCEDSCGRRSVAGG
jgi:hypothetical protein